MKTLQLTAPDAASALAQVQSQLGPDAVVLSVRPLPAHGVARLWSKSRRVEIVAGVPNDSTAPMPGEESTALESPLSQATNGERATVSVLNQWRSVAWLQAMGLLPEFARRLQERLDARHASIPALLDEEWTAVSAALNGFWKTPEPLVDGPVPRLHIFIGPPGSGKSTVLCKWLTLSVLNEERPARVWRLDGSSANTAEFLSIHCEMLGVPAERLWLSPDPRPGVQFIDLPGVEAQDARALAVLRAQLSALPRARVHLVLNAAYETSTLLAQWRAFAAFEPDDLIFTHLDEETRRVKLWNFVFAANCGIRFLSAGQKIPGEFQSAAPELLFPAREQSGY